ncbi:MAG: M16 family metallopeptidase [Opitutales bacterium]
MSGASDRILETLNRQQVERRVLDNGLTVVYCEDNAAPVVSLQLWVKTGSIHEGAWLGAGLSHYLEHLLFKGTPTRGALDISREVDDNGGYINAYTTFDRTVYYIDSLADTFAQQLDLLSDIVFRSTLPADEVTREKDVILREIDMGLDDPHSRFSQAIFKTAYQSHPYRYPVIGHRNLFQRVERDALMEYYQSRYAPNNTVLVVVGAVPPGEFWQTVEDTLGGFERTFTQDIFLEEEKHQFSARSHREFADIEIAQGGLAYRVPSISHPDSTSLDVLAAILGAGESSVFYKKIREELQLVHDIDASCWNPGTSGLFWISWEADPHNVHAAADAVRDEYRRFFETQISVEEVERAKRQMLNSRLNSLKTVSSQASRLGSAEVVVGDLQYPKRFVEQLLAVTPESLQALGSQYLLNEGETFVTLEPKAAAAVETASVESAKVSKTKVPEYRVETLDNGLRILYLPDSRLPSISVRLLGRGGPIWDPVGASGLNQLLATLLTKDTESRTAAEVAKTIDSIGASFSGQTGNNTFGLSLESLSSDLDLSLDIFSQAVVAPAFREETFERERTAQIARVKETLDDVVSHGRNAARRTFYGEHPFGRSPLGTVDDLASLDRATLVEYQANFLNAANCVLLVAGDVNPDEDHAKFASAFSGLVPGTSLSSSSQPSLYAGDARIDYHLDRQQAVVLRMFHDAGFLSEDNDAGIALNGLLSGMSSPLFQRVREEKGMAYFVGSTRLPSAEYGAFQFYAGTHPDQAEAVYAEYDAEIARIQDGKISDEEVARAVTQLRAQHQMSMQRPEMRSLQVGISLLYGQPLEHTFRFDERLQKLSPSDLVDYAQKYLQRDHMLDFCVVKG